MTYTHKLARRLALLRCLAVWLILAMVAACSNDLQDASDPTSEPDPIEALDVIPDSLIAEIGQPVQFVAHAKRGGRRLAPSDSPVVEWSASGGSITADGLFSAEATGSYKVIGRSRGRGGKNKSDTTTVVVVPPPPDVVAIRVSPDTTELTSQGSRTFVAKAVLSDGSLADVGVTWQATGGDIDAGGVYVAGDAGGQYRAVATAVSSGKADTAAIVIDAAVVDTSPAPPTDTTTPPAPDTVRLAGVRVTPASASLGAGAAQQFAAVGVMNDGTTAPIVATFTATGGTITAQGQYTAGGGPGSYRVVAASGTFADTSSVTITGGTCSSTTTRLCPGDNLQAKASAAGQGATLTLQAGVYRLQSVNPLSGQTWQGEPGAVMSGARVLTGWQSDGAGHWYVGGQTQQNTDFNPKYSCQTGHPGCYLPEQLWVDDVLYEHVTSLGSVSGGSWYFDYAADRIYLSTNPTGRTVETSVTVSAFGGSASGVTIRNLTIEKYANAAQRAAVNSGGAASWTIESNEVRDNHGIGIGIATNGIMRGNKVHHQGQMGITARSTNGLIEGNEIAYNNTAFFGGGHYAENGGSKFVNTNGLVVRNNFVHHNYGPGLWTDINNINCLYEGNRVEDNDWRGIFHEISFACVIRNNIVRRNGFNSPGARQIEGAGIVISDSPDVEVYGNTVEDNNAGIMAIDADRSADHVSAYGTHNTRNLSVHDNIIRQADAGRAGGVADWDSNSDPYGAAANNRWTRNTYTIGTSTKFQWAPNTALSRSQWQSAGQDVSSTWR
jgi:parallel beta-helix repeat protein